MQITTKNEICQDNYDLFTSSVIVLLKSPF